MTITLLLIFGIITGTIAYVTCTILCPRYPIKTQQPIKRSGFLWEKTPYLIWLIVSGIKGFAWGCLIALNPIINALSGIGLVMGTVLGVVVCLMGYFVRLLLLAISYKDGKAEERIKNTRVIPADVLKIYHSWISVCKKMESSACLIVSIVGLGLFVPSVYYFVNPTITTIQTPIGGVTFEEDTTILNIPTNTCIECKVIRNDDIINHDPERNSYFIFTCFNSTFGEAPFRISQTDWESLDVITCPSSFVIRCNSHGDIHDFGGIPYDPDYVNINTLNDEDNPRYMPVGTCLKCGAFFPEFNGYYVFTCPNSSIGERMFKVSLDTFASLNLSVCDNDEKHHVGEHSQY